MKQIFEEYGKIMMACLGSLGIIGLTTGILLHGDAWRMMLYFWIGGGRA